MRGSHTATMVGKILNILDSDVEDMMDTLMWMWNQSSFLSYLPQWFDHNRLHYVGQLFVIIGSNFTRLHNYTFGAFQFWNVKVFYISESNAVWS